MILALRAASQQPFFTDDADATEKGKLQIEMINQFDRLPRTSLPVTYNNSFRANLNYGLAEGFEINIAAQHLTLRTSQLKSTTGGVGDVAIGFKYNFVREVEGSSRPALAFTGFYRFPTGNSRRGFGNGVTEFGVNGVLQKTIGKANVLRANIGTFRSGNPDADAPQRFVRSQVVTAGLSFVRDINERLTLGAEITGAATRDQRLNKRQLQAQFGGNFQMNEKTTLDFGVIAGRYAASPRYGVQVGFTRDF